MPRRVTAWKRALMLPACACCLTFVLTACGASAQEGAGTTPDGPAAIHITLMLGGIPSPLHPPVDKSVRDAAAVGQLYAEGVALPHAEGIMRCPASSSQVYRLTFLRGDTVIHTATLNADRCMFLRFNPEDPRVTDAQFQALFVRLLAE